MAKANKKAMLLAWFDTQAMLLPFYLFCWTVLAYAVKYWNWW